MARGRGSSIIGLVVTAVIAVPSMALVVRNMTDNSAPQHDLELTSASGAVSISNSQDGQAILQARPMLPGQTATGTVQLVNTGDGSEQLTLDSNDPVDQPGPGGGHLSQRLQLRVYDVSTGTDRLLYDGSLIGLHQADLGTWDKNESRTYRFVVTFPDGGANGADNAFQGSAASIGFTWTADAAGPAAPPAGAPYDQQVAADQPTAYWPLDGSQDAANDAAGSHDGQFSNSVTTASGAPGGGDAAAFDGTTSYAYVPSLPAPTGAYTIEAWVRPADTSDQMILDHGSGAALAIVGGHFVFRQTDRVLASSATVEAGRWWHLVGTWDPSNDDARLYVDGHLSDETTAPTAPSGSSTFYIGRGSWGSGGSPNEFFHGDMAQVGYYGSALPADRVAAHFASGNATAQSSPPPSAPSAPPSSTVSPATPPSSSSDTPSSDQPGGDGTTTTPTGTTPASTCPKVSAQGGKSKPKPKRRKKPRKKSKKRSTARAKALAKARAQARAKTRAKARAQAQRTCIAPTSKRSTKK